MRAKYARVHFLLALAVVLASCIQRNAPFFLLPQTATIHVGQQFTLEASYASSVITAWVSSDPAVATVVNGAVTGQSAGTTRITAFSRDRVSEPSTITVIP